MSRDNNKMFSGQGGPSIPSVSIDEEVAELLGETANVLHDHEIPLPSRGIPYPPGHPLHGRESVLVRSMRSGDEDLLYNQALFKSGKIFSQLLRNCLIDPVVNPADILNGDRLAILAAIRISGYGSETKSTVQCPSCEAKGEMVFDMASFEIKSLDIPSAGDDQNRNLFALELPLSKSHVKIRFTTGHDEEEIWRDTVSNKSSNKKASDYLRRIIHSVNGEEDRLKISLFVDRMSPADAKYIKKFVRENEPRLKMESDYHCGNCGEVTKVKLAIAEAFFRSSDED